MEIDIRYTRSMDGAYLRKWLQMPEVQLRSPMATEQELDLALHCWMGYCRLQSSLTAIDNHVPCGIATLFLLPYRKVRHHAALKLCVDPKRWKEGIGDMLLKNIKHLGKNYFFLEAIHIEVFGGDSPLIPLLRKHEFKEFMRQEGYMKTEKGLFPRIGFLVDLVGML